MDVVGQLGVALGLATLSGVNLYLTVFITGLAVRFDWVHLADRYQSLEVLGHPTIIVVAGILYFIEFFADKVPWIDSLWDSVHTFIRPVGGALLAIQALGDMPAYVKVVAALLAGGAALTTHGAKAGTRLLINHSPEPVSNIAMSVTEDGAVTGGMALTMLHPVMALGVFSAILALIWLIFPRMWRGIRTTVWLAWNKLRMPGSHYRLEQPVDLPREVPDELKVLLALKGVSEQDVKWTVSCVSGKCKGIRGLVPSLRGVLVGNTHGGALHFAAGRIFRNCIYEIPLSGASVTVESLFLSENLLVDSHGQKVVFRFARGTSPKVATVALRIREMTGQRGSFLEPIAPEPIPSLSHEEPAAYSVHDEPELSGGLPPVLVPPQSSALQREHLDASVAPLPAL